MWPDLEKYLAKHGCVFRRFLSRSHVCTIIQNHQNSGFSQRIWETWQIWQSDSAADANAAYQSMLRRSGERACARGKHAERSARPEQEMRTRGRWSGRSEPGGQHGQASTMPRKPWLERADVASAPASEWHRQPVHWWPQR